MSSWLTKKFRRITGRFWAFKMLKMREEKQKMQSYSSSSSRWISLMLKVPFHSRATYSRICSRKKLTRSKLMLVTTTIFLRWRSTMRLRRTCFCTSSVRVEKCSSMKAKL